MPYTHTDWGTLRTMLAGRLGDPNKIFWVDNELKIHLIEALRTFGLCSGFYRERGTLQTAASTAFYDIRTGLMNGPSPLLNTTVTDRDIITAIQYNLLESAASPASWNGTEMFTYNDVVRAVQNRRNQFLSDTGITIVRSLVNAPSPPDSRLVLDQATIDVRRAAWIGALPENYYTTLWVADEWSMAASDPTWTLTPGTPRNYSVMAPPPLQMQIAPPPASAGQLELLTTQSLSIDPAFTATLLDIPDNLTPAIRWGALSDLLGIDGAARDTTRAQFAEQRYQQYVRLARLCPAVMTAELQGVPVMLDVIASLDAAVPDWQNTAGTPEYLALAGWNLLAAYPVPDAASYSITLDVVRNTPVPILDIDKIQVGREQLDMVLDYAEHLALFKAGGYEFQATSKQADNFLLQSMMFNQRLGAQAKYIIQPKEISQREKAYRPRREQAEGLGAAPSVEKPQSVVTQNAPVRIRRP